MSCWTCECGFRNCDTEDCLNPQCPSHTGYSLQEARAKLLEVTDRNLNLVLASVNKVNGKVLKQDLEYLLENFHD